MTGLDTNVLVRYLTLDDPGQARKATAVIEGAGGKESCLHVSDIALCELVWVLETAYGYGREELTPVLERPLRTKQFSFGDKDVLWQALADYQRGKGDFPDCILGRGARGWLAASTRSPSTGPCGTAICSACSEAHWAPAVTSRARPGAGQSGQPAGRSHGPALLAQF